MMHNFLGFYLHNVIHQVLTLNVRSFHPVLYTVLMELSHSLKDIIKLIIAFFFQNMPGVSSISALTHA